MVVRPQRSAMQQTLRAFQELLQQELCAADVKRAAPHPSSCVASAGSASGGGGNTGGSAGHGGAAGGGAGGAAGSTSSSPLFSDVKCNSDGCATVAAAAHDSHHASAPCSRVRACCRDLSLPLFSCMIC